MQNNEETPELDRVPETVSNLLRVSKPRRFRWSATHAIALVTLMAITLEILYYQSAVGSLSVREPLFTDTAPMTIPDVPSEKISVALNSEAAPPTKAPVAKAGRTRRIAIAPPVAAAVNAPRVVDERSADERVRLAYAAWSRGDVVTARRLYEEALDQAPRHRQARLGLAAVATRQNDPARARAHYQHLLEQDPLDGDAAAGLINVVSGTSPTEQESLIKLLIARGVHQPSLYNQLGNIHAAQGRWGEARRHYWEAFSRDALLRKRTESGDPDLAFNLAVSLDHLGQTEAAARYYDLAVTYAKGAAISFSVEQARSRVEILGNTGGGA